MSEELKVSLIGLDTIHTMEYAGLMNDPDCPPSDKVNGMTVAHCLRFPSVFQSEEKQDVRQCRLEELGINVTRDFETAVSDCDAIMLEINDPALHLEYFTKCVDLSKPIFIDKPLADTIENAVAIRRIASEKDARVFSSSAVRFVPALAESCERIPKPLTAHFYGTLGKAAAGSSVIWYGVHTFEMLQRAMGIGALSVGVQKDDAGLVAVVAYPDGRRGVVDLLTELWMYGGSLFEQEKASQFVVPWPRLYANALEQVAGFFRGGPAPVAMEETLEVMALLDAADRSYNSGRVENLRQIA
jgi:predicted dehydrogenase